MIRPKGVDLHYEVELALILGKEVKDLDAADEKGALDAIESPSTFQSFHLPKNTMLTINNMPPIQATLSAST